MIKSTKASIRKNIDVKMSIAFRKKPPTNKLPIDEDTSFNIIYEVYNGDESQYLYIKMEENTANAPFIYNRSYELKELHEKNKIFKSCESIEEIRDYLKELFRQNKIKIRYDKDEKEEIIIMEIDAMLFASPVKLEFELYREMILDHEKDDKLMELYKLNKEKLKTLKKVYSLFEKNKENIDCKELIEKFKNFKIPGIE
jgi:hypothetical protein